MRYSDTDVNGHVNNTRYADFACDAVELERLPENRFLAEMQIGYLAECRPGEVLDIQVGGQGDSRLSRVWTRRANPDLSPRWFLVNCFLDRFPTGVTINLISIAPEKAAPRTGRKRSC